MKSLFNYTVIGAFWSLLLHSEGSPWKCVLLAGRGSKRVQNMGSVYSLEYFICGSSCLMLSEACMAVSLPGHVGILDKRHNSLTDYTYFASAAPETQLLKSNRSPGYFLNYSKR